MLKCGDFNIVKQFPASNSQFNKQLHQGIKQIHFQCLTAMMALFQGFREMMGKSQCCYLDTIHCLKVCWINVVFWEPTTENFNLDISPQKWRNTANGISNYAGDTTWNLKIGIQSKLKTVCVLGIHQTIDCVPGYMVKIIPLSKLINKQNK